MKWEYPMACVSNQNQLWHHRQYVPFVDGSIVRKWYYAQCICLVVLHSQINFLLSPSCLCKTWHKFLHYDMYSWDCGRFHIPPDTSLQYTVGLFCFICFLILKKASSTGFTFWLLPASWPPTPITSLTNASSAGGSCSCFPSSLLLSSSESSSA